MAKASVDLGSVDDTISNNTDDNQQSLFQRINELQTTISELQSREKQLKDQHNETARREAYLLTKLALKDKMIEELSKNVEILKANTCGPVIDQIYQCVNTDSESNPTVTNNNLNTWDAQVSKTLYLTDPVVNVVFEQLKHELTATQTQLEDIRMAYQMLSSQQPTDQLVVIKKLIAKCSLLQNENKYLVKQFTTGDHVKLQQQLSLTDKLNATLLRKIEDMENIITAQDEQLKKFQSILMANQRLLSNMSDGPETST